MLEKLKSSKRYLFYRAYAVIAIISLIACLYLAVMSNANTLERSLMLLVFIVLLPLLIPYLDLSIFSWKYSSFGKYEKTPFPQNLPFFEKTVWSIKAGWLGYFSRYNWSGVFYIYETGVGILFKFGLFGNGLNVGPAFIPKEHIISVKKLVLGYELQHNSPELRSYIYFNNHEVAEKIQELIQYKNPKNSYQEKIIDGKTYKIHE